jgi:hypothetical protein
MFTSPLIPSESCNFPDHFRQEIASVRNVATTKSALLVEGEEPPRKRSFFVLIRNLLPARPENVFPSTPVLEPSHVQPPPPAITPPTRHEDVVSTPVAKPEVSSQADSRFAAPIAVPAKMPFRKSVVPPNLKRKARWNMRAVPAQSALPEINDSSQIRPATVPEQKVNSKRPRRPAPLPHFVLPPPPDLVQALLAYADKVSVPASKRATPALKTDTGFDTP